MDYPTWNAERLRKYWIQLTCIVAVLLVLVLAAGIARPVAHAKTQLGDWPTFLHNNARTGYNPDETIINPNTAPHLKLYWKVKAAGHISAQPIEAKGMVYWGSWDGLEHASRLSDGKDVWTANLGHTKGTCEPRSQGVLSTATVASVQIGGQTMPVVFVAGGDVQVYSLNANTGAVLWHTPLGKSPNYFLYSATAVFNKSVYIGVSSFADCPLIQARLVQLDVTTGSIQHVFNVVPDKCKGGSIWGSPTIDTQTQTLYFATGNAGKCNSSETMTDALVALSATDLSYISSWRIPKSQQIGDGDFGSTPTLFQATIRGNVHQMVGLINKNGIYYAFDRTKISAGPLWQDQLAAPANRGGNNISSSAWDRTTLYVAAGTTTINAKKCKGSLRALNPAAGTFLWQDCLIHDVLAPVTSVPGLVEIGSGTFMIIVNAATGKRLFSFQDQHNQSNFWSPASISNGVLYQGNADGYLYAFGT